MKMTIEEHNERMARSKKMLLWFGMISMFMTFAGITSAYVVSGSRPDWLNDLVMPVAFQISTVVIVTSSVTFHFAKVSVKKGNRDAATSLLLLTLALGLAFVYLQFEGFKQFTEMGYYLTGDGSNPTTSFIYVTTVLHIAHIAAALIVLLVVIYNHFKQKYNPAQTTGLELGATFWHFLDILWVYLFLFFCFY